MKIGIFAGDTYEAWSPKSVKTGIGGSEEAVIYMSRALAKLGHEVVVWNRCEDAAGTYDGVKYVDFLDYDQDQVDIFIGWRNTQPFKMAKNYKVGYFWLHDTMPQEEVAQAFALGARKVMVLSMYHRRLYGRVDNRSIYVTRNGINVDDFKQKVKRVPGRIFWGSSYDRGLKEMLEQWPKIKLANPDATLHVAYGWQTWESMVKRHGEKRVEKAFEMTKEAIEEMFEQDGITHLGRISHKQVAKEMLEADVWGYPTWWPEISCITAMKAQAGGAIPVVIPTAAVAETVEFGFKTNRGYFNARADGIGQPEEAMDQWIELVNGVLEKPMEDKQEYRDTMQMFALNYFDWNHIAEEWVKEFEIEMKKPHGKNEPGYKETK